MTAACWNVFILPINIAFKVRTETTDILNLIADLCFVVDIILMFRISVLDDNGDEVFDSKLIARKYLRGRFTIDLISALPFDYIALLFLEKEQA